jgi:hypothetical protein
MAGNAVAPVQGLAWLCMARQIADLTFLRKTRQTANQQQGYRDSDLVSHDQFLYLTLKVEVEPHE